MGKKLERKNERKIKKIDLNLINYFYILIQIHFIYFNFSMQILNNLKIYKFLINFNYILFSLVYSIEQLNMKISFFLIFFSFLSTFQNQT